MTVKELIARLKVLPPEAEIADGRCGCEPLGVYLVANKVYIARGYDEVATSPEHF